MCKSCAGRDLGLIESFWSQGLQFPADAATPRPGNAFVPAKLSTAFLTDDVGALVPAAPTLPPASGPGDNVPDFADTAGNSNPILAVTGPGITTAVISSINGVGDQDFYKVTLTAGVTYEFGLYAYGPINGNAPGPTAQHLTDPFLELYGANGTTLVVSADGGATTTYNNANSGFDVLLTYTATTTGTYYLNARAFNTSGSPLTVTGDSIGDYQIFAREQDPNDPSIYRPYYAPDEPLYATDWGTQVNRVNQSARNPDGNEGTRDTGNAQGTPGYNVNNIAGLDIAALAAAQGKDITGKNVITIYFARAGDVFTSVGEPGKPSPGLPPATITATGVQQFERDAVNLALAEFAKVADVVYLEVQNRNQADFVYTSYQGTPGPGVSLLGSMSPPDEPDEGLAQFNSGDERWNALNLAQGGFSFVTLIHEFGHGHGLAHPHDNGGHSGIMNGVESEGAGVADYTTGDFALNQSVFTMMSYEDGWQSSPYGNAATNVGYGYLGGLMAFDIAAIQEKYGVNENWATGNDTYVMKDVNAPGTFFYSIWDAGGNDTISYTGTRDTTIDLRPATLRYEVGGGGRVSFATGIFGGFTIANGVTIENATSGSGNDTLHGNAAANYIDAGDGNDIVYLQAGGIDVALGRGGDDGFYFGAAFAGDTVDGGAGRLDQIGLQGDYSSGVTLSNVTGVEYVVLLAGNDARFGGATGTSLSYNIIAPDTLVAAGQTVIVQANTLRAGENAVFNGAAETDGAFIMYGGAGTDTFTGGAGDDGFFFGQGRFNASDVVVGGAGALDQIGLQGNFAGANAITFGAAQMSGIELVVLLSAADTRFGTGGGSAAYDLTMNNGNVASGQRLVISANTLRAGETLTFNGAAETDGSFRIFAGAGDDVITGSQNGDEIFGGLGNDNFRYTNVAESTAADRDAIKDFRTGDTIDLSALAANNGLAGFEFIGSGPRTGAGQLRVTQNGGQATVEVYLDGDAIADLVIDVTVADGHMLTASDFDTTAMEPGGGTAALADTITSAGAKPDGPNVDQADFGSISPSERFADAWLEQVSLPDFVYIGAHDELHHISTSDLAA